MKKAFISPIILLFVFVSTNVFSAPSFKWIRHNTDQVGLYDKFEATFWLETEFENPFDPEDIDIMATFTAPSGKKWSIPAFYSAIADRSWLTRYAWLVRFSADELGNWNYIINVKDRNGEVSSEERSFEVVESEYHGRIKVAANKRYLEYDDGTPFYGVGMWVNNQENAEVMDEMLSGRC